MTLEVDSALIVDVRSAIADLRRYEGGAWKSPPPARDLVLALHRADVALCAAVEEWLGKQGRFVPGERYEALLRKDDPDD